MLQKFFENIFDVELYCQMVDLILRFQKIRTENRHIENFRTMLYFSAVLNRAWKRDTVCIIRERFWNVWKKKCRYVCWKAEGFILEKVQTNSCKKRYLYDGDPISL